MAVRRITTPVRDRIRELVDLTESWLPLSSYSRNAVTYTSIFKASRVAHYIPDGKPQKKTLQEVWVRVVRHHARLPRMFIRKIVPAAIDYRKHKRKPLTRDELDRLGEILHALGFDMRRELSRVELDETLPEITVPPEELVSRLENHPLAEEISGEPLEQFRNGHFNEAVRKSAERFEARVQELSGEAGTGTALMSKVFRSNDPVLPLNSLSTENEKGFQEGYMFMAMGMMRGIRNIFSHGDEEQRSPEECYEMLLFVNWLFRHLPDGRED